jgi:hypothetical protein
MTKNPETKKIRTSKCYTMDSEDLANGIEENPLWLNGVGAIEFLGNRNVARIIPGNELSFPHKYKGVVVNRLSYTPKGVLISASGDIPPHFIEALSCLDPDLKPFREGHFSKLLSPDWDDEVVAYFSSLVKTQKPIVHRITGGGSDRVLAVDFLALSDRTLITATVSKGAGCPNQAMSLDNTDDLTRFEFRPIWSPLPWSEGYDIRSLEGFTNGSGGYVFLFIDGLSGQLMKVVDNKVLPFFESSEFGKEKTVKVLFRSATGSEVSVNHLASALTQERLVDISYTNHGKMDVAVSNNFIVALHDDLRDMLAEVSKMDHPEGISSPQGFHVSKKTPIGKTLKFWRRPQST